MAWTQAMLDKAAATKAAHAAARNGSSTAIAEPPITSISPIPPISSISPGFDWSTAPLAECQTRLGDLRRAYDAAAAIVLARSAESRPQWTCWSQLHKSDKRSDGSPVVPRSILALCRKSGDNGRWASRDDGVFRVVNGIRIPDPVICCNATCHEMYQRSKQVTGLARH